VVETTAWGAACLAGLSVGVFDSLDDVRDAWHADRHYEPAMHDDERARLYAGWQTAVSMLTRID